MRGRFVLIFLFICGCHSGDKFLTEQNDGWFRDRDMGLVYCRANLQKEGSADPVCFEAGFTKYNGNKIESVSIDLESRIQKK